MAEDKKSIVVYSEWIEQFEYLTDEESGKLIKHFFRYVNDLEPTAPDRFTEMAFIPIKQQLKRDLKKWEQTLEGRSKAGKASVEAKKKAKENQQNLTKSTSVKSVKQNLTKSTVNVNVDVNDDVNVNDIKEVVVKPDINDIDLEFDKNIFKDISELKKYYLTDIRLINAFCDNNNFDKNKIFERLKQFNTHLESQSRFKETFTEYAKHFLSWHRKAPDTKNGYVKKQKMNAGELIKQRYGLS